MAGVDVTGADPMAGVDVTGVDPMAGVDVTGVDPMTGAESMTGVDLKGIFFSSVAFTPDTPAFTTVVSNDKYSVNGPTVRDTTRFPVKKSDKWVCTTFLFITLVSILCNLFFCETQRGLVLPMNYSKAPIVSIHFPQPILVRCNMDSPRFI